MGVCISSPSEKLVAAADGGNLGAVKRLLSRLKNEPNFHDPTTGLTPLLAAAAKGHVPVVKLLLDSGASVTARVSTKGRQALHFAADSGNVEVAELLVSYGANVNATAGGMSPLMLAATQPHTEMCHYLLEQGAVPDMKGPDGVYCGPMSCALHSMTHCAPWGPEATSQFGDGSEVDSARPDERSASDAQYLLFALCSVQPDS